MAGTPINNNNLPQGVSVDPNSGLYIITNDKGQTSRVGAGTQEELNAYTNSWKTGTPVTVTTTSPLDGSTSQQVYDPAKIQGQQQSIADYKSTGANTTNPSPNTAEVAASTSAVNTVTNTPSNLQSAPSDNSLNSPLTVDSNAGATVVRAGQDPQQAQAAAIINADNAAPAQVSPFNDPQQRAEAALAAQGDPNYIENFSPAPADEFAGVDQQVANNSYIDQPPTVSDEEVQQQLQAARDETIENYQAADVDAAANVTAQVEAENAANAATNTNSGLTGDKLDTQSQATQQDASNFQAKADWRVRLSLAPGASYLYKASPPGILAPLQATDGVIFPYTPAISVAYNASYDPTELTHSNYKFFTYRGSAVDSVTISCDFTAQDTFEANYLLAVIHFFKSITKMFYGQDQNPKNGTPPPLCYLTGLGAFQFDTHPLAITAFTYTLPTDVDYIIAGSNSTPPGVNQQNNSSGKPGESIIAQAAASRLSSSGLNPGALVSGANFQNTNTGSKEPTYVPTKINISIQAVPIVTRNDISNKFSLKEYATGALLRGSKQAGGGIW